MDASGALIAEPPLISVHGLAKTYVSDRSEDLSALRDISFSIRDGEFVSVVGPSGCGKSTLLKILAGLLPSSAGSVTIAGRRVAGPAADVGVVFQAPVLLPWRTIQENILLPAEFRHVLDKDYRQRALDLLAMAGLQGFENRYPYELSGGMQQRASIVRALAQQPKLLLMDEPFGALDAMTREQMNVDLLRIWGASRKTVIFITHSIGEAVFLSDRVFVMTARPGRLVEIVDIGLDRPRDLAIVNTERFGTYVQRIRDRLEARMEAVR
jgi:NitT/TauT family transport system ATP-binding protein